MKKLIDFSKLAQNSISDTVDSRLTGTIGKCIFPENKKSRIKEFAQIVMKIFETIKQNVKLL